MFGAQKPRDGRSADGLAGAPAQAAGGPLVRVLVVDDSEPVRASIRQMVGLAGEGCFEVVGEAADGPSAVDLARELRPDAVLMDINLPGCDGITAAARIREELPEPRIVMLSVENGREYFRRAMQIGATDYLVKPFTAEGLADALRGAATVKSVSEPIRGTLYAVCGCKGGVGTTTLTVDLALSLGRHLPAPGAALFDLDEVAGALAVIAGLHRSDEPQAIGGGAVTVLPPTDAAGDEAIWRYAAVLADVGRGSGSAALKTLAAADRVLVVTTAEVPALHVTARGLKELPVERDRLCLVVSRSGRPGSLAPAEAARSLDLPLWAAVPDEGAAVEAANLGRPLLLHRSRSPYAAAVDRLAGRLAAVRDQAAPASDRRGAP